MWPMVATPSGSEGALVSQASTVRAWKDVIWDHFVSLQIAPYDSTGFTGTVETQRLGHLAASAVASIPQTFTRTPGLFSRDGRNLLQVGLVTDGEGVLTQDGRTCTVSGGDFAVYETARPFTWSMTGAWRLLVFTWPRDMVCLSESEGLRITASTICSYDGVGRLLAPALQELVRPAGPMTAATAARVADQIADLTVTAALEASHSDDAIPGDDEFRRILLFVEDTLENPSLTPQLIAQHFYLSTRTLHRLFARRGLTVGGWIRTRRLEACRRALLAEPRVPVTDIGSRYGFSNPEVFSRTFAAAAGLSPTQFRKAHLS